METARLSLRAVRVEDADALARLWADEAVTRYAGGPRDYARSHAAIRQAAGEAGSAEVWRWTIVERATGAIVGDGGLLAKEIDGRHEHEIIYFLHSEFWGRGYATEAATAILQRAVSSGKRRVVALVAPENRPSIRVAEKIGMAWEKDVTRDGHLKRLYAMLPAK